MTIDLYVIDLTSQCRQKDKGNDPTFLEGKATELVLLPGQVEEKTKNQTERAET